MLTVSEKGYGKRTPLAEYRITSRGGKGVINLKTTDRNGTVVSTLQVSEESDVMIITEFGKIIRVHSNEIREAGRSTQGVRLFAPGRWRQSRRRGRDPRRGIRGRQGAGKVVAKSKANFPDSL